MQYVMLNENKQPIHPFKNGVGAKTKEEVKDCDNVAIIVPNGYVVYDFDTEDDATIMLNIIEGMDLQTKVLKTDRGIHCYFKMQEGVEYKNFTKCRLANGLISDRKVGGRNALAIIKKNGIEREWIRNIPLKDVEVMPKWLTGVVAPSDKFDFKHMGEGSGRNQELFNYIVYLQAKEFSRDEIVETIQVINTYVFDESLSDSEIETICRDEAFKDEGVIAEQIEEAKEKKAKESFRHDLFGNKLIEEFNIISLNNTLYIYENGYYQQDEKIIENKMLEMYPNIKTSQRTETLNYIKIKCHINAYDLKVDPYMINLINTRLNIWTGEMSEHTPTAIEFDRLPIKYDPTAQCEDVDRLLNRVFCNDREVIQLFEEMLGACILKNSTKYQKAFLFYGNGSNGKSTILDMIKAFLGHRNYSAIPLEKLTDKFTTAELENKLANIGDDADNTLLKDTGTLKKLISGDAMMVERKGERPYILRTFPTQIHSCNAIPRSKDKTDGFYRRWMIIPFNATFSINDEDYDPLINEKITAPNALSYLLNLALKGARRLIANNKYTQPSNVDKMLLEYKVENSATLTWINENEFDDEYFLEQPMDDYYKSFKEWCKDFGVTKIPTAQTFYKEIKSKYGFENDSKQKKIDGKNKRFFMMEL